MGAPTFVSYTEISWTTQSASTTTASITWQANDVIAVICGAEGPDTLGVASTTPGRLTFTTQKSNTTTGTCGTILATAVPTSGNSDTLTLNTNNSGDFRGGAAWVIRNSTGVGNSAEQHTSTKTVSLTPTGADGYIIWAVFDFAAAAVQTITPTPTDTRQNTQSSPHYTFYVADLADQSSTGAVSYGISGTGSGPFSIVALEIKNNGVAGSNVLDDDSFRGDFNGLVVQPAEPIISVW